MGRPGWNSEYQKVNLAFFCSCSFVLLCVPVQKGWESSRQDALLFISVLNWPWLREAGGLQEDKDDAPLQSVCYLSQYEFFFSWNGEEKHWQEEGSTLEGVAGSQSVCTWPKCCHNTKPRQLRSVAASHDVTHTCSMRDIAEVTQLMRFATRKKVHSKRDWSLQSLLIIDKEDKIKNLDTREKQISRNHFIAQVWSFWKQ